MENLTALQEAVKSILESGKKYRSSDNLLYLRVLKLAGVNMDTSIFNFYDHFCDYNVPRFESVARARRKVQELYPELKSEDPVRTWRKENETAFRNYSREGK